MLDMLRTLLRTLLGIRHVGASLAVDYGSPFDGRVGVLVQGTRGITGRGFAVDVHYWPGRVWALTFYPAQPKRCAWRGCCARPVLGSTECREHELPF